MACSENSVTDPLRDVMSLLDEVVTAYRNRGYSRAVATGQTAMALGITPRRVKSFLYGEAFKVSEAERLAIRAAYIRHLEDEADHFAKRIDAVKTRLRQMELDLA